MSHHLIHMHIPLVKEIFKPCELSILCSSHNLATYNSSTCHCYTSMITSNDLHTCMRSNGTGICKVANIIYTLHTLDHLQCYTHACTSRLYLEQKGRFTFAMVMSTDPNFLNQYHTRMMDVSLHHHWNITYITRVLTLQLHNCQSRPVQIERQSPLLLLLYIIIAVYGYLRTSLVPMQALVRGRRKKSLVHTVCACSVPPGFLGIWKFSVKSAPLH